jgi:hypothetical protein
LIINGKSGTFDFSIFDQINPLDEFDLDESMGVGSTSGESLNNFSTIFFCNSQRQTALLGGSVNWNCDSTIETSVAADLNADGSTLGILESYNDWQNIVFTGGCIGTVGDCLPVIEPYDQVSLAYTAETSISEEPLPEIDMPHKILLPPDTTYVIDGSLSATIPITITNAGTEAVNVLLLYTTQSDVFKVSDLTEQIFFQPGETILVSIGLAADIETITEEYLTITATIIENSNWVNQTTIGVAKPQNGNVFLPLILKP